MLKEEGKIGDDLINRLMGFRHSGFSVHNGEGFEGMMSREGRH